MTIYVAGIRTRLIRDSLINMVTESLRSLGWFDENRQHLPINVLTSEVPEGEDVPYNTLAFADDDIVTDDQELGSLFAEHRWSWFIDFFAEDNSIGVHLIQDVRAILQGRLPSIGRSDPSFPVFDYATSATSTTKLFTCHIEDVATHRAHGFPRAYQRYWHSVSFEILDYYGTEDDA